MSIQWMENFLAYGTGASTMYEGTGWNQDGGVAPVADPDPLAPAGSLCLPMISYSSGANSAGRLSLPSPQNTIGVAFRMWCANFLGGGQVQIISFRSVGNGNIYEFRVGANGSLYLVDGASDTVIADTVAPILSLNNWIHLEMRINCATGAIAVWKEGVAVPALTFTDPSPVAGPIGIIAFARTTPGAGYGGVGYVKDLVFYDGLGSVNNVQIGPCTVYSLVPNSDVSSGWSRTSGTTDYALVDERPPNDTGYISAGNTPLPAASIMGLSNLPLDVVSVRGVMTLQRLQKSDAGDAFVQVSLISGVDQDPGADRAIGTSWAYYADISEVDPASLGPWTPATVNAANIKINRTL